MKNKNILILGGNGKIGKPLTESLLNKNYSIISIDKKFDQRFKTKNINYLQIDLMKQNSIKLFLNKIEKFNNITGAVNCLYLKSKSWGSSLDKLNENIIRENLYTQLGLPILISKEICKYFVKKKIKNGKLINISSVLGISAPKFEHYKNTKMFSPIEYSTSKSGIVAMTKYLAKFYKGKNLNINCISPGGIYEKQPRSFIKKYKDICNKKGLLDGEDIVETIIFLLSKNSDFISGQNLIIDDGWSL